MTTSTAVEAVAPRATVSINNSSFVQAPSSGAKTYGFDFASATGDSSYQLPSGLASHVDFAWSDTLQAKPVFVWKRFIDLGCILLGLPLLLPLMALVALWIKLVSRGPVIFSQLRVGLNGRQFTLYKFRSMHMNAEPSLHTMHFNHLVQSGSPMVKLDLLCDPRLIPLGCLLRAAGLDELPQLFNVLRGDMSLVGPRPCLPEEYRFFSRGQRVRFQVLPGLTGIWQSEGKGVSTFSEMNEMDARYVKTASPFLDLAIMCRTPLAVFRQMCVACKSRRLATATVKASFNRFGANPRLGYGTHRLR